MAHNPVGWFEIYVSDMARAKAFYEAVFERRLDPLDAPDMDVPLELWAFPMDVGAPGAAGALVRMAGVAPGDGGTLIYFSCEDCAIETERAVRHGGRVHREKTSIGPYGFIALVFDTEGNMIGLHSMR